MSIKNNWVFKLRKKKGKKKRKRKIVYYFLKKIWLLNI